MKKCSRGHLLDESNVYKRPCNNIPDCKICKHLRSIYSQIKSRCINPNHKYYKDYGGRGINICPEWQEGSTKFINWALDNGYMPGLTLDRKNNNLGYSPENCRFVSQRINCSNTRKQEKRILPVGIRKFSNKYQARYCIKNKEIHIGTFDSIEKAVKARELAIGKND